MTAPVFIEGDDVTLRPATDAERGFLTETWNDPRVRAARNDLYPRSGEDIQQYLGGTVGREEKSLALVVFADEEPVGLVLLIREQPGDIEFRRGELAYWISPEEWDNGYATAGAQALLNHAFGRLGLHKVTARAFETNPGSVRVLEKLGFTQTGRRREDVFVDGEWLDVTRYELLEGER